MIYHEHVGFMPGCTDGSTYEKLANMIWHINRIKKTNQVIFLVMQKGISTKERKKEAKPSLFADNMTQYLQDPNSKDRILNL